MGNSIRVAVGNPRFPCYIGLGNSGEFGLSTKMRKKFGDGGFFEDWYVSYTVGGKTCDLTFVRDHDKDKNVNKVSFVLLHIDLFLRLQIERTETNFLRISSTCLWPTQPIQWSKKKRTIDARGSVMDTKVYLHSSRNRGDLLVLECKKNSSSDDNGDEANAVTVAHYSVNSSGTTFNRTDSDVGFSEVAKIHVFNGKLDIMVEGPEQHPVPALFYMFEELIRTGIWKRNMCPHCDHIRRGTMFWQTDSEDSESIASDEDNFNGN